MAKVWSVSEEVYSQYRVLAVFSTERKAEAYKDVYEKHSSADCVRIEEFDLDPNVPEYARVIEVHMAEDGTVIGVRDRGEMELCEVGFSHYNVRGYTYEELCAYDLVWRVQTDDKEVAVKAVNEKRAMILAEDAWNDWEKTAALFAVQMSKDEVGDE